MPTVSVDFRSGGRHVCIAIVKLESTNDADVVGELRGPFIFSLKSIIYYWVSWSMFSGAQVQSSLQSESISHGQNGTALQAKEMRRKIPMFSEPVVHSLTRMCEFSLLSIPWQSAVSTNLYGSQINCFSSQLRDNGV